MLIRSARNDQALTAGWSEGHGQCPYQASGPGSCQPHRAEYDAPQRELLAKAEPFGLDRVRARNPIWRTGGADNRDQDLALIARDGLLSHNYAQLMAWCPGFSFLSCRTGRSIWTRLALRPNRTSSPLLSLRTGRPRGPLRSDRWLLLTTCQREAQRRDH